MSKEKRSVPKLRFPGFTEDWEQCKLGSIGSTYTGLSGKTKEDFGHGEAQYITYLNVFQNTISDTTMTDKVEIDTTQNEVKYGDVLFTTSSETPEEVGMSSVWLSDTPNIYLNSFCFGFRPNQKIDPYFLGYSLRAPYMRDKIKILAQGISRYNISKNKVMELEISMPNNEEQKLLGTFLQHIDLIITLHQRKLEHLNLKKKALLQKLFPKNGERYPELRFPGFTDAWEQRKLGDIATFSKGNGYSKSDLTPSGDPIILYGRLYTNYETTISNVDTFVELKDKSLISQGGEVIVPASGETAEDISRASVVKNQGIIIGGDLNVIKVNHLLDPTFLALTISNGEQQKELSKRAQGKSVVHLHNSDLQEVNLTFPLLNEQKEISTLFEKMDNIITLHQQEPFLCGNSVNGGVELC